MSILNFYSRFPESRPRRLRRTEGIRKLVRETHVSPNQLVMPYFVLPGKRKKTAIPSMPGQFRLSADLLVKEAEGLVKHGVGAVLLFGLPEKKDASGSQAWASKGVIQTAVRALKKNLPELVVITDVCLCGFTDHGHCGVVDSRGEIDNDASLELLAQAALTHAEAGADIVAPSDMMDGRVKSIRTQLDKEGFTGTSILSYAAKYASAFYGPFRDAAHSAPKPRGSIPTHRKSYQMDTANRKEAMREMAMDIEEGADMVMVKPALSYLDIIHEASLRFEVPLAAYLVSGEYSMIKAAAAKGWLDEGETVREVLTSTARAGADILITYFAKDAAGWLK